MMNKQAFDATKVAQGPGEAELFSFTRAEGAVLSARAAALRSALEQARHA